MKAKKALESPQKVTTKVCSQERAEKFVASERKLLDSIPEYFQFCTGVVELKNCIVYGTDVKVPILHERKEGNLGNVLEVYTNLLIEEKLKSTFFGKIKRWFFPYKYYRRDVDRWYVLNRLKESLQGILAIW